MARIGTTSPSGTGVAKDVEEAEDEHEHQPDARRRPATARRLRRGRRRPALALPGGLQPALDRVLGVVVPARVAPQMRLHGQLPRVAEDVVEDVALEGGEAGVGRDAAHVQAHRPVVVRLFEGVPGRPIDVDADRGLAGEARQDVLDDGPLVLEQKGDLFGCAGQDARVDEGAIDGRAAAPAGRGHHEQPAEGAGDRQRRQRGEPEGRLRGRGVRRDPGPEIVEHLLGAIGARRRRADVLGRGDVAPRGVVLEVVVELTNRVAGAFAAGKQHVVVEAVARRQRRPRTPPVGDDMADSLPRPEELQLVGRA